MAHFLRPLSIPVTKMKELSEYNNYKENFYSIPDMWFHDTTKTVYSVPDEITINITPLEMPPSVPGRTAFWPFKVHHHVHYGTPPGVSEENIMRRNEKYITAADVFVGILWLNTSEYEKLEKNPTQEVFMEIISDED